MDTPEYSVYGIKNCNTVKSALDWLKANNVAYNFHDYKSKGIEAAKLKDWIKQVGWESLVNKRGTTWRQLDAEVQAGVTNEKSAIALMMDKTSVIKRPLIEKNGKVIVLGFDEVDYGKKVQFHVRNSFLVKVASHRLPVTGNQLVTPHQN